jgi:hypothetical protein
VAETLELEQSPIGGKADVAQFRQVGQSLADAEVVSVVDRGFVLSARPSLWYCLMRVRL